MKSQYKGKFGLEKENIRVDNEARYALSLHEDHFESENLYITRDFSESQIEMISQPHDSIHGAYGQLHNIQHVVYSQLKNEYLWPQSNPPILPQEDKIQVAHLKQADEIEYREYLSDKYGKKKSVISGIHFNISIDDSVFRSWMDEGDNLKEYKNNTYLKITKYFLKYQWVFTYLYAASPIFHDTYLSKCVINSKANTFGDRTSDNLISLRNSECGYKNDVLLYFNYESLNALDKSTQKLIDEGLITAPSEIYENVRIKRNTDGDIDYLEMRFIDINPFYFNGVSEKSLEFIHMMMLYFASLDDFNYDDNAQLQSQQNNIIINNFIQEKTVSRDKLKEQGFDLLQKVESYVNSQVECPYDLKDYVKVLKESFKDETLTLSSKVSKAINEKSYLDFHMSLAKKYSTYVKDNPLDLRSYEGMELSTKILLQAVLLKGYQYDILDQKDNFISVTNSTTKQTEYIKQATKTRLDPYINVLMMENKGVTKMLLDKMNVVVPKGHAIRSTKEALKLYKQGILPQGLVVKPNSTNFGLGITIFKEGFSEDELRQAVEFALSHDSNVLLETFHEGLEYRFLIIDGKVEGVLHRRAANVVGDGVCSIEDLIKLKNLNPLRSKGYQTPLEIIEVDHVVMQTLEEQGLTLASVPKRDQLVFLRENSNISTGGDSIDVTDSIHQSYHELAILAAQALGVSITGVDMMITDISEHASSTNYAIIELNFNPAIHIHAYPLVGTNRPIGLKILEALFNE